MNKAKRFYNLVVVGTEAELDIYGDITSERSWGCKENDMNVFRLSRQLDELQDEVTQINVNINSYGGEVAEGIAIYNALVRHKAKIVTRCDGMACSIASVIFMAGDERVMYEPSMLMIHNASSCAWGTAADLRKAAEDNEKITSMSKAAYLQSVNITEEELTALMDAETWLSPAEALNMGFATRIETRDEATAPSQSVRSSVLRMIRQATTDDTKNETGDEDDAEVTDDDVEDENEMTKNDAEGETEDEETTDTNDEEDETEEEETSGENTKANQAFRSFVEFAYNF